MHSHEGFLLALRDELGEIQDFCTWAAVHCIRARMVHARVPIEP